MTRLGRAAALLSVACAAAHGSMMYAALRAGDLTMLGVGLAMVAGCLPCAVHLWRRPSRGTWAMTAAMTALMLGAGADHLGPAERLLAVPLLGIALAAAVVDRSPGREWHLHQRISGKQI